MLTSNFPLPNQITLLLSTTVSVNQNGYIWANATVQSSNGNALSQYIYTYLRIGGYNGPVATGTIITADCYSEIVTPLQFRSPVRIGPTGSVPVSIYGYTNANTGVTVTQATLFALGNLT
jgi:hypothetical protein